MASTRFGRKSPKVTVDSDSASTTSLELQKLDEKSTESLVRYETQDAELAGEKRVVANMEDIALKALHIDDDPTLNPWTFRTFFLGL